MAQPATKLPTKNETGKARDIAPAAGAWHPFDSLRRDVDRLFEDFGRGFWGAPFRDFDSLWKREMVAAPAVDIAEKDSAYEVTVDLPGMDEKNIDVQVANGILTIKGEKKEETEESDKGYHLHERRFGSFQRSFGVPEEVDAEKIQASFKNGVLTVTLPKRPEAQRAAKKIDVKSA